MKIILIRHGECDSNGCYTGSGTDIPLNQLGIEQISNLKKKLSKLEGASTKLYSSSLLRAIQSAKIISNSLDINNVIFDNRLNEINFGAWEGLSYKQIMDKWPRLATAWYNNPLMATPPKGETFNIFIKRIKGFYIDLTKDFGGETDYVIIVSHGGVIQILATLLANETIDSRWDYNIPRGDFLEWDLPNISSDN